jgi:hypothetical protein
MTGDLLDRHVALPNSHASPFEASSTISTRGEAEDRVTAALN